MLSRLWQDLVARYNVRDVLPKLRDFSHEWDDDIKVSHASCTPVAAQQVGQHTVGKRARWGGGRETGPHWACTELSPGSGCTLERADVTAADWASAILSRHQVGCLHRSTRSSTTTRRALPSPSILKSASSAGAVCRRAALSRWVEELVPRPTSPSHAAAAVASATMAPAARLPSTTHKLSARK